MVIQASLENPWPADLSAYPYFRRFWLAITWSELVENLDLTCMKETKISPLTSPSSDVKKSKVGLKNTQICDIIKYRL